MYIYICIIYIYIHMHIYIGLFSYKNMLLQNINILGRPLCRAKRMVSIHLGHWTSSLFDRTLESWCS